ncbi:MAG: PrsW family intramembrane metalloprotease [Candidatus Eiseniibacteriota bacterium]|nr:MAG: PrsW family intramembrane metalloprotease [Candidatus Eisenbacteria bacterium]
MATHNLIRILISVLPVAIFLLALVFLDSYKLVRLRAVLLTVAVGFIVAFACTFVNNTLIELLDLERTGYARYVAPLVEEIFKASYIIFLIRAKRVGFMVDAAICGFALGAGFAVVENVLLLGSLSESGILTWIVRGFGTAVMHSGATALFGIVSKSLSDRYASGWGWVFLPGLLMAILIHSAYNHFFISPELSAVSIVVGLPLIMLVVFQQSERALQKWLGVGFDTDSELLRMITTGSIAETPVGAYLMSLKDKFPGEVVADMLCLLQLHLELSIRAKGMLLMREAGHEVPVDPEIREKFAELRYLEKSIGKTGRLTILPFLRWSSRDLWQLYMLKKK